MSGTTQTLISSGVAVGAAIITGVIAGVFAAKLQSDRLRTELRTQFMAESAIRKMLSTQKWPMRSFEQIQKKVRGFDENELRQLLIRSGALCFEGQGGKELWGLIERNPLDIDKDEG